MGTGRRSWAHAMIQLLNIKKPCVTAIPITMYPNYYQTTFWHCPVSEYNHLAKSVLAWITGCAGLVGRYLKLHHIFTWTRANNNKMSFRKGSSSESPCLCIWYIWSRVYTILTACVFDHSSTCLDKCLTMGNIFFSHLLLMGARDLTM